MIVLNTAFIPFKIQGAINSTSHSFFHWERIERRKSKTDPNEVEIVHKKEKINNRRFDREPLVSVRIIRMLVFIKNYKLIVLKTICI